MRFIYKALLFMLLFNAFLFMFSDVFETEVDYNPQDPSANEAISNYGEVNNFSTIIKTFLTSKASLAIIGVVFATALASKWLIGGKLSTTLLIGVGAFVGIIVALYNASVQVMLNIANSNSYIDETVTIIQIIFGIIIVFTVVEMFVGQQGVN